MKYRNNFNSIRLAAATGVFFSHCFPLGEHSVGGKPQLLGFLCLNVFFVVSGYLVTKTLVTHQNWKLYVKGRVLRVYPGLVSATFFTTYIVGLLLTQSPKGEYLTNSTTLEYFAKNSLGFVFNSPEFLPGVFEEAKFRSHANGTLWSLPYEITCYAGLLLLAYFSGLCGKESIRKTILASLLIPVFLVSGIIFVLNYVYQMDSFAMGFDKETYRLCFMFSGGALCCILEANLRFSWSTVLVLIILVTISYFVGRGVLIATFYTALIYIVVFIGTRSSFFRTNDISWDYSYGVYLIGYPIQQSVNVLLPNIPFYMFCIVSFSITLMLAAASWHLLEERILSLKHK